MNAGAPFHAGEQALQASVGLRERMSDIGRKVIRDHMPDQHRELFDKLPTLLLGAQDSDGQPWATMLHGAPGFVQTPDARHLNVRGSPGADDPVAPLLHAGAAVGLLGLEPHTRRRNRANGRVAQMHPLGFTVEVLQSFGNCPKYIHPRRIEPEPRPAGAALQLGARLNEAAVALLRRADTLFIASASGPSADPAGGPGGGEGVDVSHRAGPPGFLGVDTSSDGIVLTLPDYPGNHFYNTLGNLLAWPRAGLLLVDSANGDVLQVAALATSNSASTLGTMRLQVLQARWRVAALPLKWVDPPTIG